MRHAWANVALLALVAIAVATGLGGLLISDRDGAVVFWLHGVAAWAIAGLLVVKGRVIVAAIRRRPAVTVSRAAFLLLLALLLAVLASGAAWVLLDGYRRLGYFSLINVHAYLAIALALLLAWHVAARRRVFRAAGARDRAAFLRYGGAALLGLALWRAERLVEAAIGPEGRRRFTGSYERGSHSPDFPRVRWLLDDPDPVDAAAWRLTVDGAVRTPLELDAATLAALPAAQRRAILDCTGGWWCEQDWVGVDLRELLARAGPTDAARSVRVVSTTGYDRRFALDVAGGLLLATAVAHAPLTHGHGAPLRLVAPGRRGFEWVKWVERIEVLESSHRWQSPLPLQ